MTTIITGKTMDQERALYGLKDAQVTDCVFAGPADGESALKEVRNVEALRCAFSLRYPFWHARGFILRDCTLDEGVRAPIWYSHNGRMENCTVRGVKTLRECSGISLTGCDILSEEFGWRCRDVRIEDSRMESVYFLFQCRNVTVDRLRMKGKYSFQYTENVRITHSVLDTKDAFWHSKGVTVEDSEIRGEYLGWFAEDLTLIRCHISGTQPLCYCKNLRLIDCTMEGADFAFEYSSVEADVKGHILSVKNPASGLIECDSVGEVIMENAVMDCTGRVVVR